MASGLSLCLIWQDSTGAGRTVRDVPQRMRCSGGWGGRAGVIPAQAIRYEDRTKVELLAIESH